MSRLRNRSPAPRPGAVPRRLAAVLLVVQGLALVVAAGTLVPATLERAGRDLALALVTVLVLLGSGAGLLGCARGVLRAPARWRLVTVVCQLVASALGLGLARGRPVLLGAVVALTVVTVAVLFSPALTAQVAQDDEAAGPRR